MFYRLISILILFFSTSYAADKLDLGYEIPGHVQFLLRMYQAIDQENIKFINPEAFDRTDLHRSLTLFFDLKWADKAIPTTLKELDDHYGKIRKICTWDFTKILTPYWAHQKCLEVLEGFDRRSYLTEAHIYANLHEKIPVMFHDPILKEQTSHDIYSLLSLLHSTKDDQTPMYGDLRNKIPLDIALPTEIENPLFLMALADNMEYLVGSMLELMNEYQSGEVEREQFARIFTAKMMPDEYFGERPDNLLQFQYINWYINHYDVFGEKILS